MFVDEKKTKFEFWDTTGQNKYRSIISLYLRGAHIVLIVYDISKRSTFQNLSQWIPEVQNLENIIILLIGNKLDKENRYLLILHVY